MSIKIDAYKSYRMEFKVREEFDKDVYDMFMNDSASEIWCWIKEHLEPMVPYKGVRGASWSKYPVKDMFTEGGCLSVAVNFKVGKTELEFC